MEEWKLKESFDFDGRSLRWDKRGQGKPMVLVHGTPWSSFNLRHLIEGLARDYEVYYFDLMGYGQSDKAPGDVSLGIQNDAMAALLEYWELDKPIFLGHDFGGATVLRCHLLNGKPCNRLILIDPVALSPWGSPFFRHVRAYETAFAGVPDYIHEAIVEAYVKTAAYQDLSKESLEGILGPWRGKGKAAFYRQIAQADASFTDEVEDRYGDIKVPTLILWGEKDEWIPVSKAHQLHKAIPSSKLRLIAECGHLVIEEKPEELLREMADFLA